MSIKRLINMFLHLFETMSVKTNEKEVFLTFDDGPDEGITSFVLNELQKYNFKATFFCKGENAERHPELLKEIVCLGHSVGNHSYSHLHGFHTDTSAYVDDIENANTILQSKLFRPPYGALKLSQFLRLFRKYNIIYWSLISTDAYLEEFNFEKAMKALEKTKSGDIILFHFCKLHEKETRKLLPSYLKWLHENGYKSKAL